MNDRDRDDEEEGEDHWSDFSGGDLDSEIDNFDDFGSAEQSSPSKVPSWQCTPIALFHVAGNGTQEDPNWQIYRDLPIINESVNSGKNSPFIRLLKIFPGSGDQPIRCALIRRPLYDTPDYQALSYSWGEDRQHNRSICIEPSNVEILVAAHLWKAIKRLRDAAQAAFVWIDAICIDQHNVIERAAQVGIMAQIYDQARQVAIWLGDIDELLLQNSDNKYDANLFLELCTQPSPWWTRLWVLQECAYAADCPVVLVGPTSMTLKEFLDYWQAAMGEVLALQEQHRLLQQHYDLIQTPYNIWQAQKERNEHRRPLLHRLRETRYRECSNGYDKVFALRSLVLEHEEEHLGSDYRESITTILPRLERMLQSNPDWCEQVDQPLLYALHPLAADLYSPHSTAEKRLAALKRLWLQGDHSAARKYLELSFQSHSQWQATEILEAAAVHKWRDIVAQLSRPTMTDGITPKMYMDMLQSAAETNRSAALLSLLDVAEFFPFTNDPLFSAIFLAARNGVLNYQKLLLRLADLLSTPELGTSVYESAMALICEETLEDGLLPLIVPRVLKGIQPTPKRLCAMVPYVQQAANSRKPALLRLLLERMLPSRACYQHVIAQTLLNSDKECLEILLEASKEQGAANQCEEHGKSNAGHDSVIDAHDGRLIAAIQQLISVANPSKSPSIYLLLREAPELALNRNIHLKIAATGRWDLLAYLQGLDHDDVNRNKDAMARSSTSLWPSDHESVNADRLAALLTDASVIGEAVIGAARQGRIEDVKLLLQVCERTRPDSSSMADAMVQACVGRHDEILLLLISYDANRASGRSDADPSLTQQAFRDSCLSGKSDVAKYLLDHAGPNQKLRESLQQDDFIEVFRTGDFAIAKLLVVGRTFCPIEHGLMLVHAFVAACSEEGASTLPHLPRSVCDPMVQYIAMVDEEHARSIEAGRNHERPAGYFRDRQSLLREYPLDIALFVACIGHHRHFVEALRGAALHSVDGLGLHKCALIMLSARGQTGIVRFMMEHMGIDSFGDERVSNAASIASLSGHEELAQLLHKHGAEVDRVIDPQTMGLVDVACRPENARRLRAHGLITIPPGSWEEPDARARREYVLFRDLLVVACCFDRNEWLLSDLLPRLKRCKGERLSEEDLRPAFSAAALYQRNWAIERLQQRLD